MFDKSDLNRNAYMLKGKYNYQGYDWWWHSFTAYNKKTNEPRPFFIEFFVINPKHSPDTPTFGEMNNEEDKPSYLMLKCGSWGNNKKQLHRFFPISQVSIKKDAPYQIMVDDCFASDTALKGSVKVTDDTVPGSDIGEMSFDLKIKKIIPFNVGYGASKIFRDIKAFEMYWHAEGMKSQYEGTIIFDGEEYVVDYENSYGYADKNWGADFTSPWVWLSSNNLKSVKNNKVLNNSVFDIGGGRPKAFGIALDRKLLGAFFYEGKLYEFNFSKSWTHTKTKFDFKEDDEKVYWHVEQENRHAKMVTDISCLKKDMLFVKYESPDGQMRHNHLWNGGNGIGTVKLYRKHQKEYELIDEIACENVGCEYGEYRKDN